MSFATFCEFLKSAGETMHGWLSPSRAFSSFKLLDFGFLWVLWYFNGTREEVYFMRKVLKRVPFGTRECGELKRPT